MTGDPRPIRIVVADDQRVVRAGIRALLEANPAIEVVGEAADGQAAIDLAVRCQPDVVLMDIRMPGLDGIEATRRLRREHPNIRVIILTTFGLDEYVLAAVRAGASGFLLKDGDVDDLIRALKVVVTGDALMAPEALRALLDAFAATPQPSTSHQLMLESLTVRELEVLTLIGAGKNNREISEELHISEATTKTHVANLFDKLHARDRVQLVIAAYESGLVPREPQ